MKIKHILLTVILFFNLTIYAQTRVGIQNYTTVSAIQAETVIPRSGDKIYISALKQIFSWDAVSTATHDGTTVIKQTSVATGRFLAVGASSPTDIPNSPKSTTAPVAITNKATGGNIGTAATTVDINSAFEITQTTVGQTITFPNPTNTTGSRLVTLRNSALSTTPITFYGTQIPVGYAGIAEWNGTTWANASGVQNLAYTNGRVNASSDLANTNFVVTGTGTKIPFNATVYSLGTTFSGTDAIIPSATGKYRVTWLAIAGSGQFNGDGTFHVVQNNVSVGSVFVDMMEAAGVNQTPSWIDVDLVAGQAVELRYQPVGADAIIWQRGSYFDISQVSGYLPASPTSQPLTRGQNYWAATSTMTGGATTFPYVANGTRNTIAPTAQRFPLSSGTFTGVGITRDVVNNRMVILQSGTYKITCNTIGSIGGNTPEYGVQLIKNGITILTMSTKLSAGGAYYHGDNLTWEGDLTANDFVELRGWVQSGTGNFYIDGGTFIVSQQPTSVSPAITQIFTGATAVANGTSGSVPIPIAGQDSDLLRGDGTWGAGSARLSAISAAGAVSTITNGNFTQNWNWNLAGANHGLNISEGTAQAGGAGATLLRVGTLAGSTIKPFSVNALGSPVIDIASTGLQTFGTTAITNGQVLQSGATTGTGVSITEPLLTSGTGVSILSASGTATGNLLNVNSASTGLFANGCVRYQFVNHTGNGVQVDDATTTGTAETINANSATTGVGLVVNANAITTGSAVRVVSNSTAFATGGGFPAVFSTFAQGAYTGFSGQLNGIFSNVANSATNTGTLFTVQDLGALQNTRVFDVFSASTSNTNSVFNVRSSSIGAFSNGGARFQFAAHTGNGLQIDDATTTGKAVAINANTITTGTGLDVISTYAAGNSTNGLFRVANTGAVTNGIIARLQSNSTAGSGLTVLANSNVGIATTTPTSTMMVNGSFSLPFTTTGAANLTVTAAMYTINTNNAGTAITVTLPSPVGIAGRIYIVKRDFGSTGTVTIATVAGQIQSLVGSFAATASLATNGNYGQSLMLQSDNINWHRIN